MQHDSGRYYHRSANENVGDKEIKKDFVSVKAKKIKTEQTV